MDNPDDEKTIVNIKGVLKRSWERTKIAADRNDETLGAWVSRALDQLADRETGPREFPPAANLAANPPADARLGRLFDVMQHVGTLSAATGQPPPKRTVSRLYRLADEWSRAQSGMPPKVIRGVGLANGKAGLETGKALAIEAEFSE
jgi:hypothetical protein